MGYQNVRIYWTRNQSLRLPVLAETIKDLAKAKADFAGAMGSVIVAEAVAKDEVEKRKTLEAQLEQAKVAYQASQKTIEQLERERDAANDAYAAAKTTIGLRDERIAELLAKIGEVKDWLRDARAGWAGSDGEFDEYYSELAEMLDVEFTEEKDIEITFRMTARVKMPIGYDLVANDFWVKNQPDIDTQTSEVELLSNQEIYIDDLDINS